MKLKKLIIPAAIIAGLMWMAGCYPSVSKVTEDFDLVVTNYEEDQDFQVYDTYFIADTIIQLGDPNDDGYIDLGLTREDMDRILDRIVANMDEFNYVRVMNPLDTIPDIALFTDVLATRITVVYSYPPAWGWGWYGGGWYGGCCGWYYPPTYSASSYPVGTVLVNYTDTEERVEDGGEEYVYTPWVGTLNGLLYETSAGDQRVPNAIDQMFDQSQYLRQQ